MEKPHLDQLNKNNFVIQCLPIYKSTIENNN